MDKTYFFIISAVVSTFFLSLGPILYNRYLGGTDSTHDSSTIIAGNIRQKPRIKIVCGNLENIPCDVCKLFVVGLRELVGRQAPEADIVKFAIELCDTFHIEDERVCQGIVRMFKDEFVGVIEKLVLSPEEACGLVVGESCGKSYNPEDMWNITLPNVPKPPVKPYVLPQPGSPKLRILHLTDIHIDSQYLAGANADCGEPLCCRIGDKMTTGAKAAGKWGSLDDCDLPYVTLQSLFEYLRSIKDQFDYVVFTGDLPAHNVWNQSRSDITGAMELVTKMFLTYLPGKKIYQTLGNHESAPVNSFPPSYITGNDAETWLYNETAKLWKNWLPADTMKDIKRAGYYTTMIQQGLRLVSLNMNYCNNQNWWLLINTTDPMGQLNWLMNVLQKAEDNKEKVHIIGHIIPGGGSCLKAWSWNYYKVINRYESTVTAQFFGHVHNEMFTMFYDEVQFKRPTSVLYNPGSVTTFSNLNPGFRIYEVDGHYNGSSWYPLNYQNYYLNLTKVNKDNTPMWEPEYNAKADLGLKSLYPADWDDLINRFKTNDTLFQIYYRFSQKLATKEICGTDCKSSLLCDLKSGRSHDTANLCKDLTGY